MSHLEEATILTIRDLGVGTKGDTEHLETCGTCRAAARQADARRDAIAEALLSLEAPVDTETAKERVRSRLDAGPWRGGVRRRVLGMTSLRRAAAILAIAAGTAYALPGSPVRNWVRGIPPTPDTGDLTAASASASAPRPLTLSAAVPPAGILVALETSAPGILVTVVWVEGDEARITAPAGSGFNYSAGRLHATAPDGPVRVEFPRRGVASLSVDGALYMRVKDGFAELLIDADEVSEGGFVFRVPG